MPPGQPFPTGLRAELELRLTARCAVDDLDVDQGSRLQDLAGDHQIIDKFLSLRSLDPAGQETVRSVSHGAPVYSLHAGRMRGITWHDRERNVCWLLAVRLHRDDSRDDSYRHFAGLYESGRLFPTQDDYEALLVDQYERLSVAIVEDARSLLDYARKTPGLPVTAMLGQLLPVTIVVDTGPSVPGVGDEVAVEEIWFSVDRRLLKRSWLQGIFAALVEVDEVDDWQFAKVMFDRPLRPDELAFAVSHLVEVTRVEPHDATEGDPPAAVPPDGGSGRDHA